MPVRSAEVLNPDPPGPTYTAHVRWAQLVGSKVLFGGAKPLFGDDPSTGVTYIDTTDDSIHQIGSTVVATNGGAVAANGLVFASGGGEGGDSNDVLVIDLDTESLDTISISSLLVGSEELTRRAPVAAGGSVWLLPGTATAPVIVIDPDDYSTPTAFDSAELITEGRAVDTAVAIGSTIYGLATGSGGGLWVIDTVTEDFEYLTGRPGFNTSYEFLPGVNQEAAVVVGTDIWYTPRPGAGVAYLFRYETLTDTWTSFTPAGWSSDGSQYSSIHEGDGKLWMPSLGGGSGRVRVFDLATLEGTMWDPVTPLSPAAFRYGGETAPNGSIYIASTGGQFAKIIPGDPLVVVEPCETLEFDYLFDPFVAGVLDVSSSDDLVPEGTNIIPVGWPNGGTIEAIQIDMLNTTVEFAADLRITNPDSLSGAASLAGTWSVVSATGPITVTPGTPAGAPQSYITGTAPFGVSGTLEVKVRFVFDEPVAAQSFRVYMNAGATEWRMRRVAAEAPCEPVNIGGWVRGHAWG